MLEDLELAVHASKNTLDAIWVDTDKSVGRAGKKIRSRLRTRECKNKEHGKVQRTLLASQLSAMPPLEAVQVNHDVRAVVNTLCHLSLVQLVLGQVRQTHACRAVLFRCRTREDPALASIQNQTCEGIKRCYSCFNRCQHRSSVSQCPLQVELRLGRYTQLACRRCSYLDSHQKQLQSA